MPNLNGKGNHEIGFSVWAMAYQRLPMSDF
jgi:hypothetical protein